MAKLFFSFVSTLSVAFALTTLIVNAQNQSDFISIDCGASKDYTDNRTGIKYNSDLDYIDTGEIKNMSKEFVLKNNVSQQYRNVRSFPEGKRNCYKLRPTKGKNHSYLIRASFMYGNYDGLGQSPEFDVYLGVNKWKTVKLGDENSTKIMEIMHVLSSDYIDVCLVKTGLSTPFISVLELRPLIDETYVAQSGSLELFSRHDCGLKSEPFVRYQQDVLDRIWRPFNSDIWNVANASETLTIDANTYEPPQLVMRTAVTPKEGNNSFGFAWNADNNDGDEETPEFYLYLHFAELQEPKDGQTREFNIYLNNDFWYGPLAPDYMRVTTIYSMTGIKGSSLQVMFNRTENSTLPPLLNAFEIYSVKHLLSLETDQNDVDAILNVKSTYNLIRNWQGDPCSPSNFKWEGLTCNFNGSDPPRITSLDLSSSGLTGTIDPHIYNLTLIEKLDLSNNSLSGSVPDFLSQMSSLKFLNLEGNNFSGKLPAVLLEKYENGSIELRADGNPNLCTSTICDDGNNKRKNTNNKTKIIIIVGASVGGFLLVLLMSGTIFWCISKSKRPDSTMRNMDSASNRQDEELQLKKQQYSYSEILSITNNFGRILGKGGFGTVYHGYLRDSQVAVKMLSPSSEQGYKQFHTEAKLLTGVNHKNLTALIGYCDAGPNLGLVYEYISNGDLEWHLSDKNKNPLNWEERLKVATDAAQGLEYLHCGCKPPIIHRDVKTTNILLNERLQAKLSDFGLSRAFALESDSHVSTIVVGTPGYVDPQYYVSNSLTEKSDVFSFGVVLLEIITGRPATSKNNGKDHVIEWVQHRLSDGDIKAIVDARLEQDFNENSVWKTVEVAMACVSATSTQRPTMTQVTVELKQCLAMEVTRNKNSDIMSINSDPSLLGR